MSLLDNPAFRRANGIDTPPKSSQPKQVNKLSNAFLDANGVAPDPSPKPAPEAAPPSQANPQFFKNLPPEDQQAIRQSQIRNITWDIEKTQHAIDALGTSGGYVTQALRAEVEQNKEQLQTLQPTSGTPKGEEADRLISAVNHYVGLDDNFIGPLRPNEREIARERVIDAAIAANLSPVDILESIERDRAFAAHKPEALNLQEDLVPIDRVEWSRLIGPHPELKGVYFGGGAIKGPDGRLYPLVIPTVYGPDGNSYNAGHLSSDAQNVETFWGEESDWTTLGVSSGPLRFDDKPSALSYLAAFFAGTGGYQPLNGQPLKAAEYSALQISESGYPDLLTDLGGESGVSAPAATLPGHPTRVNYTLVEGRLWAVNPDNAEAYPRYVRRSNGSRVIQPFGPTKVGNAAAGADLAVTLGQGVATAVTLDDGNNGYYQLTFAENADGGLRAMLRTYSMTNQNGQINIWPSYAYVDNEGSPTGQPINYLSLQHTLPALGESGTGDYTIVQLN